LDSYFDPENGSFTFCPSGLEAHETKNMIPANIINEANENCRKIGMISILISSKDAKVVPNFSLNLSQVVCVHNKLVS
jgi:hypothetical protein